MEVEVFSRRNLLKSGEAAGLMTALPLSSTPADIEKVSRPNLILFTADDLGMQLGCYGDELARTANLDKLASNGVRFETAYVTQASCSPSRSSMLTGLYPHQNGQIGLANRGYSMKPGNALLPNLLKKAGYSTSILGKLHVNPESSFDFDFSFCNDITVIDRDIDRMAQEAETYISKAGEKPFFMMFNAIDPHRPFANQLHGRPENLQSENDVTVLPFLGIDDRKLRSETAAYYNGVTRADSALGLLIDVLIKTGKYENTLIIAIGDNGPPFTRAKTTCYEAGLRTPFIMSWPARLKNTGVVRHEMVSTVDLMPTFLDAAGIKAPPGLAGSSLIPLLIGQQYSAREYLCAEHTAHQTRAFFPRRCVRDHRFKLIHNLLKNKECPSNGVDGCKAFNFIMETESVPNHVKAAYQTYKKPPEFELYDLELDPYEMRNLSESSAYEPVLERMKAALKKWQKETNDSLLDSQQLAALIGEHQPGGKFDPDIPSSNKNKN